MNNQFNEMLRSIALAKKQGGNPQMLIHNMLQQNPQMQYKLTQFKNMTNGRNPKDFILQYAKQQGIDEITMGFINEIINN